jgi:hypothetical protein
MFNVQYKQFMLVEVLNNVKKCLPNYSIEQLLSMNFQSINQNKTTSQILFKKKKEKTDNPLKQQWMDIDHDKQLALQKRVADSRIESKDNNDYSEKRNLDSTSKIKIFLYR